MSDDRPLVAHVVYRFDTGGLENGVVNLINHSDSRRFRHAVVALTEVTGFARRIQRDDVTLVSLRKPPGQGLWQFAAWRRALQQLRPQVLHTRNLGALEMQLPAAWAGVPVRLHGEHGRDLSDPHGTVAKYRWMRRAYAPWVHQWVALSDELQRYLVDGVGISAQRVQRIHNGVDMTRFTPVGAGPRTPIEGCPFDANTHWLVGTVGRLQPEKDQATLVEAFAAALRLEPQATAPWRLVLVGEGQQRSALEARVAQRGLQQRVWFAGDRSDVPQVLRGLHQFVLPSLAEGISNTILEAMATGLPVVATQVGGNGELVVPGHTGALVPAADAAAMAQALLEGAQHPEFGAAGRSRVEQHFSLQAMVGRYEALYDRLLSQRGHKAAAVVD